MASRRRKIVDKELERFLERAMRRLQLRVFQVLTFETPVLTGFARAGWSPSTGAPDRDGPTKAASSDFNTAKGQADALFATRNALSEALAAGYQIEQGPIFIVNNVRYIGFLNNPGTSAQAPKQFVEMGIALAVRETIRELER